MDLWHWYGLHPTGVGPPPGPGFRVRGMPAQGDAHPVAPKMSLGAFTPRSCPAANEVPQ
jgi:hypothetical protein